jgi:hypothetical protein
MITLILPFMAGTGKAYVIVRMTIALYILAAGKLQLYFIMMYAAVTLGVSILSVRVRDGD